MEKCEQMMNLLNEPASVDNRVNFASGDDWTKIVELSLWEIATWRDKESVVVELMFVEDALGFPNWKGICWGIRTVLWGPNSFPEFGSAAW